MGRLFWKIFFWFWMALALLNIAVGLGVKFYFEQTQGMDQKVLQTQVKTIGLAFENGNFAKARQLLREIRRQNNVPIFVLNDRGEDVLQRPLPFFIRKHINHGVVDERHLHKFEAMLPEGRRLLVVAPVHTPWQQTMSNTPVWLALAITLVISTLVCYWLASYLSSPIRRLTTATRQLAEGNLDVRVGAMKRRDEIADLAVDFDQMADKIQHLLSSQRQLLQDISHELRSPLARMQVALALARRNNSNPATDYDRIAKDLDRLEDLIGEVLSLSRLDIVTYSRESFDLAELVATIIEDCQLEAANRHCAIHSKSEPDLIIEGSPELLRRAVENVLRNAIKFTRPDTAIEVSAFRIDSCISISVSDQGPGIPESSKDSMFEAFVRIDPARSHKPGGYGLGLAIAKKAIELHGGTIAAENRAGGGLTVTITLPGRSPG